MKLAPPAQSAPAQSAALETQSAPDAQTAPDSQPTVKRLASVTWDLNSHKLVWVVEKGNEVDGQFVTKSQDRYELSPAEASMALKEEKRPIDSDEASSVHELLSVLSLYCVESTVWWENGGGAGDTDAAPQAAPPAVSAPAAPKPGQKNGNGNPAPSGQGGSPTPITEPQPKPPVQLIPGALVAAYAAVK